MARRARVVPPGQPHHATRRGNRRRQFPSRGRHRPRPSAAAHVAGRGDAAAGGEWPSEWTAGRACTWRQSLRTSEDEKLHAAMRRHAPTGRPMGFRPFLAKLEPVLDRPPPPKPRGRPAKQTRQGK